MTRAFGRARLVGAAVCSSTPTSRAGAPAHYDRARRPRGALGDRSVDNFGAKLLLLVLAAVHLARSTAAARARVAERPEVDGLAAGLLAPVVIMTLALAANGLAMLQRAYLEAVALAGAPDPAFSSGLLLDQAAVWVGTGALFEIARRALAVPFGADDDAKRIGLRVQIAMYRKLLAEHLPAVLGLGVVFGIAAGPGVAALLAAELAFMWGCAAFALQHLERKRAR